MEIPNDPTPNEILAAAVRELVARLDVGPPSLLDTDAAAALCNVSVSTYLGAVNRGVMPRRVAFSAGTSLWRRADVERAIAKLKTRGRTLRGRKIKAGETPADQEAT